MGKRSHRRNGGRTTPKGTQPPGFHPARYEEEPDEIPLLGDVRRSLSSGEPLDLLADVSSIVAAVDPRARSPFERRYEDDELITLDELVATFVEVDRPETSALLAAIAELAPEELTRARVRRAVAGRRHPLPPWLASLGTAEAHRCVEMVHVLGDGDDLIVGVRLADGHELTAVVYIDHNAGTATKDAFVVPTTMEDLLTLMRENAEDPEGTEWRELDPADARVRITEATDHGAMMLPPFESESWPACRPVVEWIARLLPEGGQGYHRPSWDDDMTAALADDFFASPFGARLDDEDHRSLLQGILWFGTDYGPGDPLRWSPVAVEIILGDWIPRKLMAPVHELTMAPELLRAFVAYCHQVKGIRPSLTDETLAAIDAEEREYQQTIRSPRPQGPAALLAAMGVLDGDEWDDDPDGWDDDIDATELWANLDEIMLERLRAAVGGAEALTSLTDGPLPDEPFDRTDVPGDVAAKVDEVVALCDRCCDELLDVEHRTACRRFVARVATSGPEVFRRKGRADTAAAAICWIIAKANDSFRSHAGGLQVKHVGEHFGLGPGGVSQRAGTLLRAAELPHVGYGTYGEVTLGLPELLVGARRRRIIDLRDRYSSATSDVGSFGG